MKNLLIGLLSALGVLLADVQHTFAQSAPTCPFAEQEIVATLDSGAFICINNTPRVGQRTVLTKSLTLYYWVASPELSHAVSVSEIREEGLLTGFLVAVGRYDIANEEIFESSTAYLSASRDLVTLFGNSQIDLLETHRSEITYLLDLLQSMDPLRF